MSSFLRSISVTILALCLAGPGWAQAVGDFPPGVLTTIAPDVAPADTVQVADLVEIRAQQDLQWTPNHAPPTRTLYEMAESVRFRRDVWCLELSFKPLRMIWVDVPQPSGRMQRKLLWYLVYRVRNTGVGLSPKEEDDGTFTTSEKQIEDLRFIPQFVLVSHDKDSEGKPFGKAYLDRIVPTAYEPIQRREFSGNKLLNSVEMASETLPVESGRAVGGRWGVAIWEDLDPRIDFFAVYVAGLSNAYRFSNPDGAYQAGDPPGKGRQFQRKTLQLNFWRPGDDIEEDEQEVRFGTPLGRGDIYDSGEGVASRWIYR